VLATGPFLSIKLAGVGEIDPISAKNVIDALDDFFDLGTYPIFHAKATTFYLKVAESIKTSLEIMFALYEVM